MIQDIKLEIIYNAKFSVICPQCSSRIELNQAAFSAAISRCVVFECPDCKNEFYFELHSLTRAAELPLEPTTDGTPTPPTSPHYCIATENGGTAVVYIPIQKAAGS